MEHTQTNAFDIALVKLQELRDILTPHEIDIVNIKNIETIPNNAVFSKEKQNSRVEMDVKILMYSPNPSKTYQESSKSDDIHP